MSNGLVFAIVTCDPPAKPTVGVPVIPTFPLTAVVPCATVGTGWSVVFVTTTGVTGGVGAALTVVRDEGSKMASTAAGTRIDRLKRRERFIRVSPFGGFSRLGEPLVKTLNPSKTEQPQVQRPARPAVRCRYAVWSSATERN